jgi:long-chain acyl-CoA synthetase
MTGFLDRLLPPAVDRARGTLECRGVAISMAKLRQRVLGLADELQNASYRCVALAADNGIDWIVADLACLHAGIRVVPIPLFFSAEQVQHVLASSAADGMICDSQGSALAGQTAAGFSRLANAPTLLARSIDAANSARVPEGTDKITYTSGTTGTPKGVCLGTAQMLDVANSLVRATGIDAPRHLCILPLSTLLENIAGVYAPLLAEGTIVVPPLGDIGFAGSSSMDTDRLLACITEQAPTSLILLPEILRALTDAAERNWRPPSSLRFVAVGGSKVAADLVLRARKAGIPAFEGYGLSECGSVVSLNVPERDRVGSVGQPLDHVSLRVDEGQIVVSGNPMLGYVDQPETWHRDEIVTGDLGDVADDGFAFVQGRSTNLIITSFGRNISPEWVESELLSGGLIEQAVVVGDSRPWCAAIVFAPHPEVTDTDVAMLIHRINLRLPDYARVRDWIRIREPLTHREGLLTANGRPRRAAINAAFSASIDNLYSSHREACNQ